MRLGFNSNVTRGQLYEGQKLGGLVSVQRARTRKSADVSAKPEASFTR